MQCELQIADPARLENKWYLRSHNFDCPARSCNELRVAQIGAKDFCEETKAEMGGRENEIPVESRKNVIKRALPTTTHIER